MLNQYVFKLRCSRTGKTILFSNIVAKSARIARQLALLAAELANQNAHWYTVESKVLPTISASKETTKRWLSFEANQRTPSLLSEDLIG